jgi:choline dehydrogenase-like flavoprotein
MSVGERCVVVGAGPTAVAAAKALIAAGRAVTVIDTGLTLEPAREAARQRMAATVPAEWDPADVAMTSFQASGTGGRGFKRLFGSDVVFRDDGVLDLHVDPEVGARPSYSLGGLSNIWGSGLLPYTDEDMAGWPVGFDDLAEGYRAVLSFLPYAAEEDGFVERYPLLREPDGPLLRTAAGEALLARMRRHGPALRAAGYTFGPPRLAVRVGHPAPQQGCVYCRHCLDGCPYGHIYTAADTIEELRRDGAIDYRPGLHVDRVREHDDGVALEVSSLDGGQPSTLGADRVFLAAGVFSTTIILQRSGLLPARAEILDSQALYLPFVWVGRVGQTGREPGHTLAQTLVVLEDPDVASKPIHMALYSYSDGTSERAREVHPRISALLGPALEAITRRLTIGICFFHSQDSDRVASAWNPHTDAVRLEAVSNQGRAATIARFQRALLRSLGRIGIVPLAPLAELAPAGGGMHFGGSAPMRERPGFGETDTLGRPSGARAIHVVDSSCFPCVPGGAITFSAMANSHRIATAAAAGESQP